MAGEITHHQATVAHIDGTQMFLREDDRSRQTIVASTIERLWGVRMAYCGDLSYVDYLAVKNERPLCWVELISRSYTYERLMSMGGVWLKYGTYTTLAQLAAAPLSIEWAGAVVVWHLSDGLYWKSIRDVVPVADTAHDPRGAVNDVEPAVLVNDLTYIGEAT